MTRGGGASVVAGATLAQAPDFASKATRAGRGLLEGLVRGKLCALAWPWQLWPWLVRSRLGPNPPRADSATPGGQNSASAAAAEGLRAKNSISESVSASLPR